MNKKPYQAPEVKKVKLEVKESVLAFCHTSPEMTPGDSGPNCISSGCFTKPT